MVVLAAVAGGGREGAAHTQGRAEGSVSVARVRRGRGRRGRRAPGLHGRRGGAGPARPRRPRAQAALARRGGTLDRERVQEHVEQGVLLM